MTSTGASRIDGSASDPLTVTGRKCYSRLLVDDRNVELGSTVVVIPIGGGRGQHLDAEQEGARRGRSSGGSRRGETAVAFGSHAGRRRVGGVRSGGDTAGPTTPAGHRPVGS